MCLRDCRTRSERQREKQDELKRIKLELKRQRFELFSNNIALRPYLLASYETGKDTQTKDKTGVNKTKPYPPKPKLKPMDRKQGRKVTFLVNENEAEPSTHRTKYEIYDVPEDRSNTIEVFDCRWARSDDSDNESDDESHDSTEFYHTSSEFSACKSWDKPATSQGQFKKKFAVALYNQVTNRVDTKIVFVDEQKRLNTRYLSEEIVKMLSHAKPVASTSRPTQRPVSPSRGFTYYSTSSQINPITFI